MDEKAICTLTEMGVSRATALSALRASRGDVNEAAMVVFDAQHSVDDPAPSHDADRTTARLDKGKQKQDESAVGASHQGDGVGDDEDDDFNYNDDDDDDDADLGGDFFEGDASEDGKDNGADPFAQIAFQKDRRQTVIEVEEEPVRSHILVQGVQLPVHVMQQGEWMKGCPEGEEQSFLFQVFNRLLEKSCRCPTETCSGSIQRNPTDLFAIPATFQLYLQHLETTVQKGCPHCRKMICLACGEEGTTSTSPEDHRPNEPTPKLLHCPDLQAVILGVGLSLVERMYHDSIKAQSSVPGSGRPFKKTRLGESTEHEVGSMNPPRPNKRAPVGTGYGGVNGLDDQSGQEAALKAQLAKDRALASLLASVRVFMPNRERKGTFRPSDHMPSIATAIHIRRRFNPISSELLKNDSLADMSERSDLYTEFLEWSEIMAAHENLCAIMGQPIMRVVSINYTNPKSNKVTANGVTTTSTRQEKVIVYEGSAGPRELLEGILRQVKAAKRAMSSKSLRGDSVMDNQAELTYYLNLRAKENAEVEKLTSFCDAFEKAVESIDRSMRQNNTIEVLNALERPKNVNQAAIDDLSSLSIEALQKRYVSWAEQVRYDYFDFEIPEPQNHQLKTSSSGDVVVVENGHGDGNGNVSDDVGGGDGRHGVKVWDNGPGYKHAYSTDIQSVFSYPSRNTAIAREHSTLSSSLPVAWDSSVFIRVDESRPDVMKALITGPEGTPYSNGCFIFDIFLGTNYNSKPPCVKTMTTKGGKYRLNPNLYADGKVCLSLLGTWSGPGWLAGKSTLLQVIISIQSMILCEEPYLNEPGWATMSGTAQSKTYNLNVRRLVIDDAMLDSLKKPNPAFEDVIRTHFRLKSSAIRAQLHQWLNEDDGQGLKKDNKSGAVGEARPGTGSDMTLSANVKEMYRLLDQLDQGIWPVS